MESSCQQDANAIRGILQFRLNQNMLWVLAGIQEHLHELSGMRTDGLGPAYEPLWRPFLNLLMGGRHVF